MIELLKTLFYLEVLTCAGLFVAKVCLKKQVWQELGMPLSLAGLLLPASACLLPNLILVHAVMFLVVPLLAWGKPHRIGPVYIFSLMLLPGLENMLFIGGTQLWPHNIHSTLGIGALLALLAFQPRRAGPSFSDGPFALLFLLMLFMTARNTFLTNILREAISGLIQYAIPYYVLSRNARRPEDLKRLMVALCLAGLVLSFIAMFEVARSWPVFRIFYLKFETNLGAYTKVRAGFIRSPGPFIESTSFAFVLTFCFLSALLLRQETRSLWRYGLMCSIALLGLLPPQSRGAWVGALFGLALARIYLGEIKKLMVIGIVLTCIALAALPLIGLNEKAAQFVGLSGHAVETMNYRERLLERGIEEVSSRPWTGTNHARLQKELNDMVQGEGIIDFVNHPLYVALIAGIPGLILFIGALAGAAYQVWRRRAGQPSHAFAMVFVGTVVPLVMLAFTSFGERPALVVIMFIGLAAALTRFKPVPAASPVRRPALPLAGSPA